MAFCVENNFEILLTIDKNMLYPQNIEKYNISHIVFDGRIQATNATSWFLIS